MREWMVGSMGLALNVLGTLIQKLRYASGIAPAVDDQDAKERKGVPATSRRRGTPVCRCLRVEQQYGSEGGEKERHQDPCNEAPRYGRCRLHRDHPAGSSGRNDTVTTDRSASQRI